MSSGETSERRLIRSARGGDQDAFAELVVMHADHVFGALRRFGLDAGEADEVAQEVFLRAWRGLARFEERAQLSTWLYRIAFNEAQRRILDLTEADLRPFRVGRDSLVFDVGRLSSVAETSDVRQYEVPAERLRLEAAMPGRRGALMLESIDGRRTGNTVRVSGWRGTLFLGR